MPIEGEPFATVSRSQGGYRRRVGRVQAEDWGIAAVGRSVPAIALGHSFA
jgi:hypothetical protein